MTAAQTARYHIEKIRLEVPRKLKRSNWSRITETEMRSVLGLPASRDLLEFRPHPQQAQRAARTPGEINFFAFCLNSLFNDPSLPAFEITPPPKQIMAHEQPWANVTWRWMMNYTLSLIDPNLQLPDGRNYQDLVFERCKRDPIFFTNGFVWGEDPREDNDWMVLRPFILWDEQEVLLLGLDRAIEEATDLYCKKGRGVGATYIGVIEFVRRWRYRNQSFLCTTIDMPALDGPNVGTLFGKFRHLLRNLPPWMMPPGWSWQRGADSYSKKACLIKPVPVHTGANGRIIYHPDGAAIVGHAAGGDAAVSRRFHAHMPDELGPIGEKHPGVDRELMERGVDTVRMRYCPSTPRSPRTYFSIKMRERAEERGFGRVRRRRVARMELNWRHDPTKNQGMCCFLVRPQTYATKREYYGILGMLYYLQQTGEMWKSEARPGPDVNFEDCCTEQYLKLIKRCRRLDRKTELAELKWEFSPWYLGEMYERHEDEGSATMARQEVDGLEADDEMCLFKPSVVNSMDLRAGEEFGDFEVTDGDHRQFKWSTERGGKVEVWKRPNEVEFGELDKHQRWYVITADAGGGVGKDASVVNVWDVTELPVEQVAQMRSNEVGPIELGHYVWFLHKWYNGGFVGPEGNKEGGTLIKTMVDLGVPVDRIYAHGKRPEPGDMEITKLGIYQSGGGSGMGKHSSRTALFSACKEIFESIHRPILIHSQVLGDEMIDIPANREKSYNPEEGKFDDTVITLVLVVPTLEQANKVFTGREIFDTLGKKMALRELQREEERERFWSGRRLGGRLGGNHPNVPAVWQGKIPGRSVATRVA